MRKLFAVLLWAAMCGVGWCQVPPDDGALFTISYTDAADRAVDGTVSMTAEAVALDVMLIGDDGTTHFANIFPRVSEAGEKPDTEVVVFYDDTGLLGGSIYFEGFGLLSTEIEVGTVPAIEAGGIVLWNQGTQYASAGQTGPAETSVVNVPEPASLGFTGGFVLLLVAAGVVVGRFDQE